MKPLTQFEIQELVQQMSGGEVGAPLGSLWCPPDSNATIYMVLLHANMPTGTGPVPTLVLQAIPSGEAWIQPKDEFMQSGWENVGFVWDRDNAD